MQLFPEIKTIVGLALGPLPAESLIWLSPSYNLPRTKKSMVQGNILIHAPTPPAPDSSTHRLSFEAQIPSTNDPKLTSRICAGFFPESVLRKADLTADVL